MRVVVADDSALVRDGLRHLLPQHGVQVVATAAASIRERSPDVGLLVLSQHIDTDYALRLLRNEPRGCGYLLKERITDVETLVDAIHRVSRGESVIDRELVELLLAKPATHNRL